MTEVTALIGEHYNKLNPQEKEKLDKEVAQLKEKYLK